MAGHSKHLGKLVSVHGISPVYLQRAAFIAVLAFAFFLAMMLAFYFLQGFIYFLLATAFLLIYLMTLVSWFLQKRRRLRVYEHGIAYSERSVAWEDIKGIREDGIIELQDQTKLSLPESLQDLEGVKALIRRNALIT